MIKENSKAVTYSIPLHCHEDKNNGDILDNNERLSLS